MTPHRAKNFLPAFGIAATLLAVSLAGPVHAAKPHPLFGNPVLGNSAELVTMWPTGAGQIDSLRITDFIPLPNPGWLSPRPSDGCSGGIVEAKFQQLDAVTGDFDGDGRDDLVAAYTMPTSESWIQRVKLEIPDIRRGPLDWTTSVESEQGLVALGRDAYGSPSNVRLAAGNFDSDGAQEFVLATRVQTNFHGLLHAGDQFGISLVAAGDVDGDGIGDLATGASLDDDGGSGRGAVWILFLRNDGTVRSQQKISSTQGGFTGTLDNTDQLGYGVAALGDRDGDQIPDLAVSAVGDDDGGADRGAVWVLHLNRDGTVKSQAKISATQGGFAGPLLNGEYFGMRLTCLGDLDGDGVKDLAVSTPVSDDGGTDRGAVWVLFLNAAGGVKAQQKISSTAGGFGTGLDDGDIFGMDLMYHPNFGGAGSGVLFVGASRDDDGGTDRGAVWLLHLNTNGTVASKSKISSTSGNLGAGIDNSDGFGYGIAALPDGDGDGVGELAIGAPFDDDGATDAGAVYLVYPTAAGVVKVKQKFSSTTGGFTGALASSDQFGTAIASPGDLDHNGKPDLVVGAIGNDVGGLNDSGAAWFVFLGTGLNVVAGQLENSNWRDGMIQLQLMELDGTRRPVLLASTFGAHQDEWLKESTRFDIAAGDFDGDGIDELALGGVRRATGANMEVFVSVYAHEGAALVEKTTSAYAEVSPGGTGNGWGYYYDHVAIATGSLRTSLTDQIVFSWARRYGEWYEHVWGCGVFDNEWEFFLSNSSWLSTLTVNTAGPWTIAGWATDQKTKAISGYRGPTSCGDQFDPKLSGPSLGVAVGDLTGDGLDEVAWATLDKVYVYQLNSEFALVERTSDDRTLHYNDPSRRVVEIADLDATPGSTAWRAELVFQDWISGATRQRLRVFSPILDANGVITSMFYVNGLDELQVPYTAGDIALAVGDFNGDAIRLGEPTHHTVTEAVHPSVILGAPPVHFDVFEQPYDLTGCYPDTTYACDPDFQASYSKETSQEFAVQTEIKSDWGLSAGLKANAEGFGAKVEASMTARYGENFGRTSEQTHSYTVSEYTITDGVDRILADVLSYELWEYPVTDAPGHVVGHVAVIEPGSAAPATQWFTYESWASITGAQAPIITHEPGNILSYAKNVPASDEYGERWKADLSGWEVGSGGVPQDVIMGECPPSPHCFDLTWSDISGGSVSNSWNAGFEVGASASYEASDPLGTMSAGISVSVEGSYSTSELATHKVTIGQDIHLGATFGHLGGAAEAPYTVFPYVYRSATSGTLVLDYKVEPVGVENWWDLYRAAPDLTFILPRLHREEKGFPMQDPTTKYRSPDLRLFPERGEVGDTVEIRVMVRNFSLKERLSPVAVRFYAGDPDGAGVPMHDVNGQSVFMTGSGIAARDGAPVIIHWVVPPAVIGTVRIYAVVDPDAAVAEVHENNNKAYALFASSGVPVWVPPSEAAPDFALEQSAPNPFGSKTLIRFALPVASPTSLHVYDVTGRRVATLVDGVLPAGQHTRMWDGRASDGQPLKAGVYFYQMKSGKFVSVRRAVLIR